MFDHQFELLKPGNAYLLLVLVPLTLFGIYSNRLRKIRLSNLNLPGQVGLLKLLPILFVTVLLILALLRPSLGQSLLTVKTAGTDIIAIVDISLSMNAKDIPPTRITVARRKLLDLLQKLEHGRSGDRLGLVLFAGDAYLYCPPTADYSVLKVFINSISTELISSGGSSLRIAVKTAVDSLESANSVKPKMILLTDGEDLSVDTAAVVSIATEKKIAIDAIGIGTPDGTPIELSTGYFLRSNDGQTVITKLNEDTLRQITSGTAGRYSRVSLDDSDLDLLFSSSHHEQRQSDKDVTITIYKEAGPYLVWLALLILFLYGLRHRALIVLAVFLFGANDSYAQTINSESLNDGYRAYQAGDFTTAQRIFSEALKSNPNDPKLLQALGSTFYKMKDFSAASKQFERLKEVTKVKQSSFDARYDLGNSKFNTGDFRAAIKEYEDALSIAPQDQRAKHNLELAKLKLKEKEEEKKKKEEQKKENKRNQDNSKEKDKDPSGQPSEGNDQPEDQPGQDSNSVESESPSPEPTKYEQESQAGQQSSPTATPTPDSNSDRSNSGNDKPDQQEKEQKPASESADDQSDSADEAQETIPLKEAEARRWLESLPDSPVLLQRKRSRNRQGAQSW